MSQLLYGTRQHGALPGTNAADGSAERLAAARDQRQRSLAAADAILDNIHNADNERFLEQVRQSGGQ